MVRTTSCPRARNEFEMMIANFRNVALLAALLVLPVILGLGFATDRPMTDVSPALALRR
jgi:hypothetical protein